MSYYETYSVEEPVTWKAHDRSYYIFDSDGRPYHSNVVVLHASMCCETCVQKVRKSLKYVDDVESVDVDIRRQRVVVRGHVDPGTILRKVQKQNETATFWDRSDDYANHSSEAYDYSNYRPTSSGHTYYGRRPASEYVVYIKGADDYHHLNSSYNSFDSSPSYDYVDSFPRSTGYSRHDHYDDKFPSSYEYAGRHNDYPNYHRSYDAYRHHSRSR